jgi:hypothetical protein
MSTVGSVVREHAWVPVPCAPSSGILRGMFVGITAGLAVIAASSAAVVGVATSDADDDKGEVDVAFRCSGSGVQIKTTTALAVVRGDALMSTAGGLATPYAAGTGIVTNAIAISPSQNGTVEAVLV